MSADLRVTPPTAATGNVIKDSALGLVPETVAEIAELSSRVWRTSGLPPSLLEIIRLRNARTVNCVFCRNMRYDEARADGLTEERAAMVSDGYQASALTDREKLALALADAYLGFPVGVDADLAARLTAEFSANEIASILVALMTFHFTSRGAVSLGGMPDEMPVTVLSLDVLAT